MAACFQNKVVLITGGAGAIGCATAEAFAGEGATVVLAGRDTGRLAEAATRVERAVQGGTVDSVRADVTSSADVSRLIDTVVRRHGRLHVAFNCAGMLGSPAPVAETDEGAWARVLDVNLTGTFLAMKHEIAHMKEHGGGTVVNMASNIGAHGRRPGFAAYAAAKAGVSVLTRTAARECVGHGVRINAVSPGSTDTQMSFRYGETTADRDARIAQAVPAGRVATTAEVAAAVLWLAGDESTYVVGHDLVVDGGATA